MRTGVLHGVLVRAHYEYIGTPLQAVHDHHLRPVRIVTEERDSVVLDYGRGLMQAKWDTDEHKGSVCYCHFDVF